MTHRGTLRDAARSRGIVHVARAVLLVAKMSLLLENPQQRPHGRGYRRIGQPVMDLRGRRPPIAVDDVHDLPLTTAEMRRIRSGSRQGYCGDKSFSPTENILSVS